MALGARRLSQNAPEESKTDNLFVKSQPKKILTQTQAKSLHNLGKNAPLTKLRKVHQLSNQNSNLDEQIRTNGT